MDAVGLAVLLRELEVDCAVVRDAAQKAADRMKKSVAIFSDNDPYVPADNQDRFRDVLRSKMGAGCAD